eukprot:GHVN01024520.1.p3 GENE.GHVN01024520.1~~GHVN01024520.1.p3  ORF type:complete len:139 (+),score=17.14 GHVN01024520.1:352-768(+)
MRASCGLLNQIPMGSEKKFVGVIDLIYCKAITFEGGKGEKAVLSEVPHDYLNEMEASRAVLFETLSDLDDDFAEAYLEDPESCTPEFIKKTIRKLTLASSFAPVFVGSAKVNKGVQQVLDGVCDYLPHPGQPAYLVKI